MKELGEYLKSSRLDAGISIEEVSDDLGITPKELENLEEGNIRAFKDIYDLKEIVIKYSKYLGINTDKILDEFNDFMFEHTSKISLEDIKEARKQVQDEFDKPKIKSPYTYKAPKKFKFSDIDFKKIITILSIIAIIVLIIIFAYKQSNKEDNVSTELIERDGYYEFTN